MSTIVGPTDLDLAALAYAWEYLARPKQIAPPTPWRSFSIIAARGWGKTRTAAELVIGEVLAGRAKRIGFCSFNLDETLRTLVYGEAGLLAASPPWARPEVIKGQVVWPSGAIATPYTPEVPDGPRGASTDLFWCSEIAAWGPATRVEFFANIREGLRLGLGRMVVDSTPRARNPLVRFLLERSARDPDRHVVVRGATRENAANLTAGFVDELEAEYGGTARGRQELFGVYLDESEGAIFKQADIDAHRRDLPTALKRRVLSVDPAITSRRGSDRTGIVDAGLGLDDQILVIDDLTGRHTWEQWGELVVRDYFAKRCDVVLLETNRGGSACTANVRAAAQRLGFRVEVVAENAVTRHTAGTIYCKEIHAKRGKDARSEPVSALYQRGRVSHVRGADLEELETTMTTWVPDDSKSPDGMDALTQAVTELAGLNRNDRPVSGTSAIAGAVAMMKALGETTPRHSSSIGGALSLGRRGTDRI
jgi:phage terminase large subunit-like protein